MLDETWVALASVRFQRAKECLRDAEETLAINLFKNVANRSYYCIFHAMRAVLALEGFDSKKHSGIISQFHKNYIRTGVFPAKLSNIITLASDVRNFSDYDDFYIISKEKVTLQLENARAFLAAVEEYLVRTEPDIASVNINDT